MTIKWDTVVTATLVGCALIVTALFVRREFAPPAASTQPAPKPVLLKDWTAQLDRGIRLGSVTAPVQLMEFADFECPFCASFHKTLKALRQRYPGQVAISYVHFPLPMHRFAEGAARAADCAAIQGRFEAMSDRLFDQQPMFGIKPWTEFAAEAGVPDPTAFESCIKSTDPNPRIVAGQQLGHKFDIQRTPTIIVNGWKLATPPSIDELDRVVKAVLAGESPVLTDQESQ